MRACDVLHTLDRVALFRAQAKQSNRHLEDLGNDLSSALALLDARQSRGRQAVGASNVTQGADRAVLEWSQGVIVKLLSGLSARPSSSGASGGDQRDTQETSERHARNARRWLSDPRTWEAFVRSIEGSAVADPSVGLSLSASLAVLRAAIFTVRSRGDNAAEGRERHGMGEQKTDGVLAQEWAAISIHVLCNGIGVEGEGCVIRTSPQRIREHMRKMELPNNSEAFGRVGLNEEKHHESRALVRVTLDAFVTLMEEVLQGHVASTSTCRLREAALTDLLRFQVVLQGNQPNRRKVFSACCGRLMNALFQILPSSGQLRSAIEALLWNAFFHDEHLEGFREAFAAAEASGGAAPDTSTLASVGKGNKRRKKNKSGGTAGGEEVGGGGSASTPLRVCYQQQLLEELSGLVSARSMEARLAAAKGAPLLLEGFVLRLGQAGDGRMDIHQAAVGGTMARNPSSVTGGKRLRPGATSSRPGVSSSSPASQMFKMWASLTAALAPLSRGGASTTGGGTSTSTACPVPSPSLAFLHANNAMLKLLAEHDVYRINEDWGGREFKQLKRFATELLKLAGSDGDPPEGTGTASEKQALGGFYTVEEAVEFAKAFQMLLRLNHNILHDNLRPLLRMAVEWAASAPGSKTTLASERKHGARKDDSAKDVSGVGNQGASRDGYEMSTGNRVEGVGRKGLELQEELLRRTAIELVVNLVETYGRLRQIDHLVQALFGAVADAPSASASVLRGDECVTALARAFRRLPEGQIESMWHVFAGHLRASWTRCSGASASQDRSNLGTVANARDRAEDEIVAKELDAELFVLFLRNLHVTSSVAFGVGKLCSKLAQESLRFFSRELERVAGTPFSTTESGAPSTTTESGALASSKKRKKGKQLSLSTDRKVTDADRSGSPAAGRVLAFRPALDVHGWLLELDTRCRFWAAVLNASPESGTSMTETVPMNIDPHHDEDQEGRDGDVPSGSSAGSHPLSHGALQSIVEFADKVFGEDRPQVDDSIWGASRPEMRLRRTLQQVAVHRVEQIYARLNGAVALEGVTGDPGEGKGEGGRGAIKEEEQRLETEARALTDFACKACVPHGRMRGREKAWGDEDDHVRIAPSWSMMMPYLPVWVGFAFKEQVVLFLEALFTRCAKDMVAGRTQDESPPLRLLMDTSFYETEAVAQCAPRVILSLVYRAIRVAVDNKLDAEVPDRTGSHGTLDDLIGDIQSLASSSRGKASCFDDDGEWWTFQGSAGNTESALENDGTREGLGTQGSRKGVGKTKIGSLMPILEACALLLLTERFPQCFFEEDATGGLMVAIEALDAVCFRSLLVNVRSAQCPNEEEDRRGLEAEKAALLEVLASLRSLLLRLGLSLPPNSPLLERLPAADTVARVISPGVSGSLRLLRSSVTLTPFLAARCVASGQVEAILAAVSRINTPPLYGESAGRPKSPQRKSTTEGPQTEFAVQMALLHALLSGVVAGETRRLTVIESSDSSSTSETEEAMCSDEGDSPDHGSTPSLWLSTPEEPSLMLGLVARLVALLPQSRPSAPERPREEKQREGLNTTASPVSDPLLLCVWGDALRLSFLNPNAEELVFEGPETIFLKRNRSEWVEDIIYFLEASLARSRAEVGWSSSSRRSSTLAEDGQGGTPSQRSAVCGLVRAVCGCCHLLDPHLQPQALEALVKVFISAAAEGVSDADAANGGERLKGTRVLESAFCLLVQHASDVYLRAIFLVLLETLEAWGPRMGDVATGRHDTLVAPRVEEARPAGSRRCLGENGSGGQESSAVAAITFIRLTALSGHGGDFAALMRDNALALVTVLCNQLRLTEGKFRDGRGRCNVWRNGPLPELENGTRVLDALGAILNRHPFSSVSSRVVSVVLGSIEVVGRVSVLAVESAETCSSTRTMSMHGNETFGRGDGMGPRVSSDPGALPPLVEVLLARFRACCRLLCTLLQHYPRKVCACTPPFAALCRSLLRLFFCLASPEMDAKTKNFRRSRRRNAAERGEGQGSGSGLLVLKLSVEQQVDAASSLARVLEQFTPHKDNFKKYSVFFLLEYISLAGSMALEPAPKSAFHAGIFAVMDTCTPKEMRQLHGLLGALPTGQEVFRSLHEEYIRQYKYTGKI